jgi:acetyl esterase/lipase
MAFHMNLDPELTQALAFFAAMDINQLQPENIPAFRQKLREMFKQLKEPLPKNGQVKVEDHQVPGPADAPPITLRVYTPRAGSEPRPCLYWIHGGGMILGDIDLDDRSCQTYAAELHCVVVSVRYRLAPEHPHPAPVEDCYAGLKWTAAHASRLGIDGRRLVVGGASAGGGLAAATALLARDRGGPAVSFQCLIYPMLDDRNQTLSSREFVDIPSWGRLANIAGWTALLGSAVGSKEVSPYAAPARATDLSGLPPALVQVGELEVFRDEDIDYATRLMQAGVATELHVYPGAYHGWDSVAPEAAVSKRAIADRMDALRRAFQRPRV